MATFQRSSVLPLLLALTASSLSAQHPAPIGISDYSVGSAERQVSWAQISPDGSKVAYMVGLYNSPGPGQTTVQLLVRNADGSSATTTQVRSITSWGTPRLSATWRWDGTQSTLLYIEQAPSGDNLFYAWTPTSLTLLQNILRPSTGTESYALQERPCGDVVIGRRVAPSSVLGGTNTSQLWHANLAVSGAPIPLWSTSNPYSLVPIEASPNGTLGLYRTGGSSTNYRVHLASDASTPIGLAANASSSTVRGFVDDANLYAESYGFGYRFLNRTDLSSNWSIVTNGTFFSASSVTAVPGHLGGFGIKDTFVYLANEGGAQTLRMGASVYGSDVVLTGPTGLFDDLYSPSASASGDRVAYIASDNGTGGGNQVFVVATNRELRATFSADAINATYTITAPCGSSELCLLGLSGGLAPNVFPWGPPGQVDLDPNGSLVRVVAAGAPVFDTFNIPVNPSFLGIPFFFQVLRDNAGALNSTRAGRVIYM